MVDDSEALDRLLLICARVIAVGFACVALLAWLATRPERYQPPPQVIYCDYGAADLNRTIAIWEPGADDRWYQRWIPAPVCHPRPPTPPPPEVVQGVQQALGELDAKAKAAR
jgi:hypothetical protein